MKKEGQLTDTLTRNIRIISVIFFFDSHDQNGQYYDTYKNGQYCRSYDRKTTKM